MIITFSLDGETNIGEHSILGLLFTNREEQEAMVEMIETLGRCDHSLLKFVIEKEKNPKLSVIDILDVGSRFQRF